MSHIRSPQLPGPTPAPDDDEAPEEAAPPEPTSEETSPDAGAKAAAEPEPEPEAATEAKAETEAAKPKPVQKDKSEPEADAGPAPQPATTTAPAPALTPASGPTAGEQPPGEPSPEPPAAPSGWRVEHPRAARAVAWTVSGLAVALVMFALLVPNDVTDIGFGRFLRIPAEGILVAGLLLVLPAKARRVAVVVVGVLLGLLTIVKVLDMGSYWTLDRPFDLVLDWILLDDAQSFMKDSLGGAAAQAATVGVIVLALALPVLMTLAVVRISRLMARHRHTASRTLLVLGTAWITCSTLTLEVSDVPVASHSAATLVENRIESVGDGLKDGEAFRKQSAVDAFADVPPDQLLTGLRGKDVLITFIESYGRSAIDDPRMGEPLSETLSEKTQALKDAGYASQSGWLRSPITGAGSWLGHSTFLSGLWIKNQSRYSHLVASDRLTLTEAFRRTGAWRTVGIVPGTQMAWPEGKYFGLDHIYDSDQLGYKGPKFSWSTMPDQYTLKAFEELEHGKKDREPMMAEIILTSSHNPWAPIPSTIPEDQVGDGSIYHSLQKAEGKDPTEVWKDPLAVRDEYRKSIQYSVTSLVDYVAKYGSKDTVLIFLGDHQP
ncbi:sulfatase, partial [Streptomyces scabiei]